jgi:hypothetical protein
MELEESIVGKRNSIFLVVESDRDWFVQDMESNLVKETR